MGKIDMQKKINILLLKQQNLTTREIATKIRCAQTSVSYILRKYSNSGSLERKVGSGRPRATNQMDEKFLKLRALRDRFKTPSKLRAELYSARQKRVSTETIKRRLKESGLFARKALVKSVLTTSVRKTRLAWAKEHVNWSELMWYEVIFSDESKFKMHVGNGRLFVRRRVGERLADQCLQSVPVKTEGVMVWGCISGDEKGHLTFIDRKITGEVYLDVLRSHLEPSVLEMFGETCDFTFQQDNAPPHKSRVVKDYFTNCRMTVLDWPPYSPDLNPIENVWAKMKLRIAKERPDTAEMVKRLLKEEWDSLTPEYLVNLTGSMKKRCQAVIDANGGPTKY